MLNRAYKDLLSWRKCYAALLNFSGANKSLRLLLEAIATQIPK